MSDTREFEKIFEDELKHIPPGEGAKASKNQLLGLAFSGGGIRSATFNLGVLQALASLGFLKRIHYLSTVSGGGYIGSWFLAWVKRKDMAEVTKSLQSGSEPHEIKFLRSYSNYLTPRLGLFSADTWAVVSIYTRNLLLNLTIIVLALTAILLIPRFVVWWSLFVDCYTSGTYLWYSLIVFVIATFLIAANIARLAKTDDTRYTMSTGQGIVVSAIVPLIFLGAVLMTCWFWFAPGMPQTFSLETLFGSRFNHDIWEDDRLQWVLSGSLLYAALWIVGWALYAAITFMKSDFTASSWSKKFKGSSQKLQTSYKLINEVRKQIGTTLFSWKTVIVTGMFAGVIGGILFFLLHRVFQCLTESSWPLVLGTFVAWSPILVILILTLVVVFHIGLMGKSLTDEMREWWSRLGAWLSIYSTVWGGLWGLAIFGPLVVLFLIATLENSVGAWIAGGGLSLAWVFSTLAGIIGGKSERTGKSNSNRLLEIAVQLAPMVFVVGLLLLLSIAIHFYLGGSTLTIDSPSLAYWYFLRTTDCYELASCLLVCLIASFALSWRVDINEFSMHAMYRNRLVRCYLGASNNDRNPHPFTGFDKSDDKYQLGEFKPEKGYQGPFPIINTAVNLVQGKELAWQQRKASSFIFTPLHCGYEVKRDDTGEKGAYCKVPESLSLGTAMAISGAAASPNMGYHSSAPLAFLMTVFNVRLGWWLANPKQRQVTDSQGPRWGLTYLLCELFGATNDERDYVYLSDGGHFENLGLYELVRRRCRFIIACDASADPDMNFGDLGNAIEKCRTDFSVEIDVRVHELLKDKTSGRSKQHCAVGKITYPDRDYQGVLLYMKPTLTGDEPTDVLRYANQDESFPHQSTADQFFDESQFESYRALGKHITRCAFEGQKIFQLKRRMC